MKTKKDSPKKTAVAKVAKLKKSAITKPKKETKKKTNKTAPSKRAVNKKNEQTKKGAQKNTKKEPRKEVVRADRKEIKNHKKKLQKAADLVLTQEPGMFGAILHTKKWTPNPITITNHHCRFYRTKMTRLAKSPWSFELIKYKIVKTANGTEEESTSVWETGWYECRKQMSKEQIRKSRVPEKIVKVASEHFKKYKIETIRLNELYIDKAFIQQFNENMPELNPSDFVEIRSCMFDSSLGQEDVRQFLLSMNVPNVCFANADPIIEGIIDDEFIKEFVYKDVDCSLEITNTSVKNRWSASDDLIPVLSHFTAIKLRSMILEPSQLAKLITRRMLKSQNGGEWKVSLTSNKITDANFSEEDQKKIKISMEEETLVIKSKDNPVHCNIRFTPSTGGLFMADFTFMN